MNRRDLIDLAFFFGVWMYELQAMYKSYDASGHFDIYKVPMALAERDPNGGDFRCRESVAVLAR